MSIHRSDIANRLKRYLDRRQPPRRIEGKPQAEADEVAALVATIERNAPRSPDALAEWWPRFERQVGENGTGLWPTEKELRDAAMATNKATPKDPKQDEEFDWYEVMGKRMAEGKDVGENYLYGREAVELIRRKLVDEETMRLYRSAAFFARKEIQTEASALEWEAEAKARHQAAKDIYRDPVRQKFNASLPDLTSPAKDFTI